MPGLTCGSFTTDVQLETEPESSPVSLSASASVPHTGVDGARGSCQVNAEIARCEAQPAQHPSPDHGIQNFLVGNRAGWILRLSFFISERIRKQGDFS